MPRGVRGSYKILPEFDHMLTRVYWVVSPMGFNVCRCYEIHHARKIVRALEAYRSRHPK